MASRSGSRRAGNSSTGRSAPGYLSMLVDDASQAPRAAAPFRPDWGPAVGSGPQTQELAGPSGSGASVGLRSAPGSGSGARSAGRRTGSGAGDGGELGRGRGFGADRSGTGLGGAAAAGSDSGVGTGSDAGAAGFAGLARDRRYGSAGSAVGSDDDRGGDRSHDHDRGLDPTRPRSDAADARLGDGFARNSADVRDPGADYRSAADSVTPSARQAAAQNTDRAGRVAGEQSADESVTAARQAIGQQLQGDPMSLFGLRPLLPERPALDAARANTSGAAESSSPAPAPPAVQIGVVEVRIMPPAPSSANLAANQAIQAGQAGHGGHGPGAAPARLSRPTAAFGLAQG